MPDDQQHEQTFSRFSVPILDPTALTTQQLVRESAALKELVFARLDAMDKAVMLFGENLTRVPTDVDKQVGALKELVFETFKTVEQKFTNVTTQFEERDVRVKESATSTATAVAAALQAAKEAVGEQNKSFTLSIDKSEAATAKQIDAMKQNYETALAGLTTTLNDIKERQGRFEGTGVGVASQKSEMHQSTGLLIGFGGLVIGAASIAIAVVSRT